MTVDDGNVLLKDESRRKRAHSDIRVISYLTRRQNLRRIAIAAAFIGLAILFYMVYHNSESYGISLVEDDPVLLDDAKNLAGTAIDPKTGKPLPRKALIVSSYTDQDVSWLNDLPKVSKGWEIFRYVFDKDAEAGRMEESDDGIEVEYLTFKGRESLAYLTFIVNHYESLPDIMIFLHGHRYSWHQPTHIVDLISALNLTAVHEEDYVSLRCERDHGCNDSSMFRLANKRDKDCRKGTAAIAGFWKDYMLQDFGPLPPVVARACCAQFAVTAKAVRNRPLELWKKFHSAISHRRPGKQRDPLTVGLVFEIIWHIIFGKPAVHCPSYEYCRKVFFQDKIFCPCEGELPCAVGDGTYADWRRLNCTNSMRNFRLDSEWTEEQWAAEGHVLFPQIT